jgi:hypothetical protein
MLEGALDLLVERVPRWIDQSSGSNAYEHLMDMGRQHAPLGRSEFESFVRPWFQFIAASNVERMTHELAKRQLMFVRDFALLVEQGKRDGSIREDADSNLIAWALMMWGWAEDVARLVGLEDVMGPETSTEIFRRMLGDLARPRVDPIGPRDERDNAQGLVERGAGAGRVSRQVSSTSHDPSSVALASVNLSQTQEV